MKLRQALEHGVGWLKKRNPSRPCPCKPGDTAADATCPMDSRSCCQHKSRGNNSSLGARTNVKIASTRLQPSHAGRCMITSAFSCRVGRFHSTVCSQRHRITTRVVLWLLQSELTKLRGPILGIFSAPFPSLTAGLVLSRLSGGVGHNLLWLLVFL